MMGNTFLDVLWWSCSGLQSVSCIVNILNHSKDYYTVNTDVTSISGAVNLNVSEMSAGKKNLGTCCRNRFFPPQIFIT